MLTLRNHTLPYSIRTHFPNLYSLRASSRLFGATNIPPNHIRSCSSLRFSVVSSVPPRTYQVVVAATCDMGIGKEGKLPWKLPSDLKFFKEITTTTLDPTKRNAVIMGRKTWESVPLEFRPLPARLNVVLTRSGLSLDNAASRNVVVYGSIGSALEALALPPYSQSIEKVFVIGGGQVLWEALNGPQCDAIHITEIETSLDCDTFIPAINLSSFRPWYTSQTMAENNVRFSFVTYVHANTNKFGVESFDFLPRMIFERHGEHSYLRLLREIISSGSQRGDKLGNGTLSSSCCEMWFDLRKCFPLLTTKRVPWDGVIQELFRFTSGSTKPKLAEVIDEIKNNPDGKRIILSAQNPSDVRLELSVANGELSCQTYQHSADLLLTVPLSIASYALLTSTIAHVCGLVAGSFAYKLGEAHVNRSHIRLLQEQLYKLPKPFPILKINPIKKDIDTLLEGDFELIGYEPHL